jgi:HSP20 family protein
METGHKQTPVMMLSGYFPGKSYHYGIDLSGSRLTIRPHLWRPPTDLYETDDKYIVRVEIAGVTEEDLSVVVNGNFLIISGARQNFTKPCAYHQMEIRFGEFQTEIELPSSINTDNILAEYQNGFLTVTLPKQQPRQVYIG